MYGNPVTCIRFAANNTDMIVAACLRSFLENKIARLCILFTDYICLFPLI